MDFSKDTIWDYLFSIACAFYYILSVVCLADCCIPAMEKLKYYVLQADHVLQEELPKIDIAYATLASNYKLIITDDTIYQIGDVTLPIRKSKMVNNQIDAKYEYFDCDDVPSKTNLKMVQMMKKLTSHPLMTFPLMMIDNEGVTFVGHILVFWKQC